MNEVSDTTSSSSGDSTTRKSCLRQRYLVTFMILLMTINLFANRSLIGETLGYFAVIRHKTNHSLFLNQCVELQRDAVKKSPNNFTKILTIDSDTSKSIQGIFFISYLITHFPSGIYSDSRNPKHLISFLTIACSLINFSSPSLIKVTKGNVNVMRLVTVLLGAFQGIFFPATATVVAHWAPTRERAALTSITVAGLFFGLSTGAIGTKFIVQSSGDWTTPFYVFGAIGIILTLVWELWVFPNPHKDPRITPEEKQYLDQEMHEIIDHRRKSIPYVAIITSFQVWIMILAHISNRFVWNITGVSLPDYMQDVLKYSHDQSKLMSSLPLLPMAVTLIILGYFSDWITRNGHVNVLTMRKLFSSIGIMGPPIYMLTGSYAGCNRFGAVVMLVIGVCLMGFSFLGLYLLPMDLSPNYTGFLTSFTNGVGSLAGYFVKKMSTWLVPDKTILQYRHLFWVSLLIAVIVNTVYVMFGTTKLQSWNRPLVKRK
ncbi:sialin-like [Tribolium madens]|uniref:sialin-like n=1 Tax=Tribolium madens TaxID=41895 RepID=UPI001CF74E11|nr:sialin-like [Tribolium madens]